MLFFFSCDFWEPKSPSKTKSGQNEYIYLELQLLYKIKKSQVFLLFKAKNLFLILNFFEKKSLKFYLILISFYSPIENALDTNIS